MAEGNGNQTAVTSVLGKKKLDQPYSAFRFLVKMGNETEASCAFTSFSGVKMNNQVVKLRSGKDARGVKDNYPGITEFQNVTLKKGVIESNSFLDWIFSATFPNNTSMPVGSSVYCTLTVVALTQDGREGVKWELLNAIPVSYELQPMDASQSGVLCETLEFAICGVERKVDKGVSNQSEAYERTKNLSDQYRGKTVEALMEMQKTSNRYLEQAKLEAAKAAAPNGTGDAQALADYEEKEKTAIVEKRAKQKKENEEKLAAERERNIAKVKELMDEQRTSQKFDEERAKQKAEQEKLKADNGDSQSGKDAVTDSEQAPQS